MMYRILLIIVLGLFGLAPRVSADAGDAPKPNIILIFVDDMGYGCSGAYGDTNLVPVPHIDRIAHEGIRFTEGYVTAPGCGPSRYGLLYGAYQQRFGVQFNTDAYSRLPQFPNETLDNNRVPATQPMMPIPLSEAGYTTGLIGKYNLPCYPNTPFDETMSVVHFSNDFWPDENGHYDGVDEPKAVGGHKDIYWGPKRVGDEYVTDRMGRQAVDFIERHAEKPFFLYLAFNAVHSPMQAKEAYKPRVAHLEGEARQLYGAMMISMDENVGRVLDALDRMDIADNTLVVFSCDNGASFAYRVKWPEDWPEVLLGSSGPLRAHKGSFYEGGIRVPFMMRWPAKFAAGRVFDQPVSTLDLYPTFCSIAGAELPKDAMIEGKNLMPYLEGEKTGLSDRTLQWFWNDVGSMRKGDWKLVAYGDRRELYNLKDDLGETTDLAKKHPELFKELNAEHDAFRAEMPPRLYPLDLKKK
ncbi:MAG: sulfatase-like hydrolase/transferase [Planctomycetota bacterium]